MEKNTKKATLLLLVQLFFALLAGFFKEPTVATLCLYLGFLLPLLSVRPRLFPKDIKGGAPLLLLFPLFLFINALSSLATGWVFTALSLPQNPVLPNPSIPLALLFDVFLAALCEEIFCRGILYKLFRPLGAGSAILATAIAFSMMHANPYQLFYALLAGLFLGFVREASGSFLLPLLFHLGNNLVSLLVGKVDPLIFLCATLVLSAVCLFFFLRKHASLLPKWGELRPKNLKSLFTPPFILYLLLMLTLTLL